MLDTVYPPQFTDLLTEWYEQVRRGEIPTTNDGHHPAATKLPTDWTNIVRDLCHQWWPPELYPNWLPVSHPAAAFVSVALIWNVRLLDADSIMFSRIYPISLRFDPRSPTSDVAYRASQASSRTLLTSIQEHFLTHPTLTESEFLRFTIDAAKAALDIYQEDTEKGMMSPPEFWLIPLFGGMTGQDWRDLEQEALRIAQQQEEQILARASQMLQEGVSQRQVANLFGYSRGFVASLTGRRSPAPRL